RGCVRFGLRALGGLGGSQDGPREPSGRDYMRTRRAGGKARQRLAEELHEPRARLSRARTRFGGASRDLLQAAYLVPRRYVAAFGDEVRRLEAAHADLTIVCTGPWPPYTFAANGEGEA